MEIQNSDNKNIFLDANFQNEELDFGTNEASESPFFPSGNFSLEEAEKTQSGNENTKWKILIVDDEKDIHAVIKLALQNFSFQNKELHFIDAYSAQEAQEILLRETDIALVLLDVVMETNNAGLQLVQYIRNQIKNNFIRIVLWTGQPGQAPEKDIIVEYEINDYRTKTELTSDKLFTVVLASLRNYLDIHTIESYRSNLEQKVAERTKQLQEKQNILEKQHQQLIKVNATKDKFFRIISHDLKNPLAAILSIADSLANNFNDIDKEDIQYGINRIKNSSGRLYDLLQNLLQWAKTQNGSIPYQPQVTKLQPLIDAEIALASVHAERKHIKTINNIHCSTKAFADTNTIKTVFRNIYSNAIKFSPSQSTIHVDCVETQDKVNIRVADQGVGLTDSEKQKLFRVDSYFTKKGTANEPGSGLGLLICMELIEQNGGEIKVESTHQQGSTFCFSLPKSLHKANEMV